jgi:hypothetical protein
MTCEVVLSETSHLLGARHSKLGVTASPRRLVCGNNLVDDMNAVLKLLERYADVPMSFADACLVRMTEMLNDPMLLTTDTDFRIYLRHGRQVISVPDAALMLRPGRRRRSEPGHQHMRRISRVRQI